MKILWTALKVLLVLVVVAALGVGAFLLSRYLGWPDWMAAVLLVGVLALFTGVFFIRSLINRRREEGFVRQVIEQDEALLQAGAGQEARQVQELEERWKESVDVLRRSHLKKLGNPIYVLPWYLMIGEPSSGKTTALRNSRLPSSFPDVGHPADEGATRNCDWWFFDQCVVFDTAGRYALPGGRQRSKEEWKKLLSLLSRARKREPLNGVVVCVPADKLTKEHSDYMEQYGQTIYLVIEQAMRIMGARIPVYILVTKADQVMGMNTFCHRLPWKAYKQAMGCLNKDLSKDHVGFMEQTLAKVSDRLKDLRLLVMQRAGAGDPSLMIFPDELSSLRPGLIAFIRGAFQVNPYQETPLLRGIFFGSGKQSGEIKSNALASMGASEKVKTELPGTNRGLFLQDFFSKVLPEDRYLFKPMKEFVKWKRSTRDMGLVAIFGAAMLVIGLFTFSFVKNLYAIESFRAKFTSPPELKGEELSEEILLMDLFRKELIELQKLNQNWWLPRMGLRQSIDEENSLKNIYRQMFEKGLLNPIDKQMNSSVAVFDRDTPNIVIAEYVEHLVRRINLVNAHLSGQGLEAMAMMPQPSHSVVLLLDKTLLPNVAAEFNPLYIYYLNWHPDATALIIRKQELQSRLIRLIEIKGERMEWLVDWVETEEDLDPVTFAQFWRDRIEDRSGGGIRVSPAYTLQGKQRIDDFISQMKKALASPSIDSGFLPTHEEAFNDWYKRQYIKAWYDFGNAFLTEERSVWQPEEVTLRPRDQWQLLAVEMTTFDNPYFDLTERMALELEHLKDDPRSPAWLRLVVSFQPMKSQVESEGFVEEGLSLVQSVEQVAVSALKTAPAESKNAVESHLKAVEELKVFQIALQGIAPVLDSDHHAYQLGAQLFKQGSDPAAKSPFTEGYLARKRLESLIGSDDSYDDLFWEIIESPLDFLLYYTLRESACSLQSSWEEEILAEAQGIPESKMQEELFKDGGLVWKFTGGAADPFLARNERGFYSRESYNQKIPYIDEFFRFLQSGAVGRHSFQEVYEVSIEGYPVAVNDDALERPEAIVVEMICSDGLQKIDNYNYPVLKAFKWSPETCGGLKLKIRFKTFTLERAYPNFSGFPEFLAEFRNGNRMFTPADFPIYAQELDKRNVKWVNIRFGLAGHEPVIDLIEKTPLRPPRKIVYCWR